MTVTLLAVFGCAAVVDESAKRLAATVALALKRADVTQDFVSRVTRIPASKLSDQLAGKLPLTGLCRILTSREIKDETDFWLEFTELLAESVNRAVVSVDLGHLVARMDEIVGTSKRMARMALPATQKRERA